MRNTPLTLSSVRRKVEVIRSPSGSADSSRKGWPPKVGNGRRAAQKPNACHPVASRSRRCPLQAPPRFCLLLPIHGEVAPKAPEGLRRPHSWGGGAEGAGGANRQPIIRGRDRRAHLGAPRPTVRAG